MDAIHNRTAGATREAIAAIELSDTLTLAFRQY
jgi:hypothetical protein